MRSVAYALSLVFIFVIPWEGVIELPGLGSGAKLIGFGLAACWVAMVVITGQFRKPSAFHVVFYLFVLWIAVSVFWSADPGSTVIHTRRWVQLLILVVILWDLYTTRSSLLAGLQAYILGAFVAIGIAFSNFLSGNVFYSHYQRFSPSEQTNPDGFGVIVALGIPVAWYLASSKFNFRFGNVLTFVNYAYIPAAFTGITLSGTRTALIMAIPGMAFGLASLTRLRLSVRIAMFLLLSAVILLLLPRFQTLRSFQRFSTTTTELTEGDLNNRTNNWQEGLESFAENPLLGVGGNMYRSVNRLGKLAHNSFISVLVEVGLIGFTLFGIMLTMSFMQALNHPKWDAVFWVTVLLVWALGASTLTWEHRKGTWLFLSLVIVSGAVTRHRGGDQPFVRRDESGGRFPSYTTMKQLPQGEKRRRYLA